MDDLVDDLYMEIMLRIPTFAARRTLGLTCKRWRHIYWLLLSPDQDLTASDYLNKEEEEEELCGPRMVTYSVGEEPAFGEFAAMEDSDLEEDEEGQTCALPEPRIPPLRSATFDFALGTEHVFRRFQVVETRDSIEIHLLANAHDSFEKCSDILLTLSYLPKRGCYEMRSYIGHGSLPKSDNPHLVLRGTDDTCSRPLEGEIVDIFDLVMLIRTRFNRRFQYVPPKSYGGYYSVYGSEEEEEEEEKVVRTDPTDFPTEEAWKEFLRYDPKLARRIYHFPYFVKERERCDREYYTKRKSMPVVARSRRDSQGTLTNILRRLRTMLQCNPESQEAIADDSVSGSDWEEEEEEDSDEDADDSVSGSDWEEDSDEESL